jgi:hypothetical protein
MRLWVDEHREPNHDWVWIRTAGGAQTLLAGGCVERISLPHDQPETVGPVMDWIRENAPRTAMTIHRQSGRSRLGTIQSRRS